MADLTHTSQGLPEAWVSLPYPQSVLPLHTSKQLRTWVSLPNPQASQLGSQLRSPLLSQEAICDCPPVPPGGSLHWPPMASLPGPVPSACASPIRSAIILTWCQVCLPSELSVTTVSLASPSLGLDTECT